MEKKTWSAPGIEILEMAETENDDIWGDYPDGGTIWNPSGPSYDGYSDYS